MGNKEEVKELKLLQAILTQAEATITLFLVGDIDVIANILLPIMYIVTTVSVEPSKIVYIGRFLAYPIEICVMLSKILVYGLYMKKIRKRLPICNIQWSIRHNRVGILHQQPRGAVMNS